MAAVQSDNWAHLRAHLDDAIDDARQAALIPATAMLLLVKGDYYWRAPFGDRSSNIERAVEAFLEGFALSSTIPNSSLAIESAQWLAVAYGERMLGDALEDLPRSEQVLREILDVLPIEQQSVLAMCRTNLAVVLLRTFGNKNVDRLHEARELCREALRYRRVTRDANDWTYTQLTLGDIERQISVREDRSFSTALRCYKKVIEQRKRIFDSNLVAAAYHRWVGFNSSFSMR